MGVYIFLIIAGLILWANNLGFRIIDFGRDWPLLLVIVGVWGILENVVRSLKGRSKKKGE